MADGADVVVVGAVVIDGEPTDEPYLRPYDGAEATGLRTALDVAQGVAFEFVPSPIVRTTFRGLVGNPESRLTRYQGEKM
jgi:hypothetical protein